MSRALFVVHDFPPATSSGVFRPLRFLKRLPQLGWSATVIAPRVGRGVLTDPALLQRLPPEIRVVRVPAPGPRLLQIALNRVGLRALSHAIERFWRLPDPQRGWVPFATRAARKALSREPHDVVWTTSAPYSTHLVGRALRQRKAIPWVADFRDEWGTHPDVMRQLPTEYHRRLHRRLEAAILETADRVVGVSETFVADLRGVLPHEESKKFVVLSNGYDEEDFPDPAPRESREHFVVSYSGRVYGRPLLQTFVDGVRRACQAGSLDLETLRVEFVGHGNEKLDLSGLPAGIRRTEGQVPHATAVDHMRRASLLLLLADPHRGPGMFPGKVFPYLASGRRILALGRRDSELAGLITRAGAGCVVAPGDSRGVAHVLVEEFRRWSRNERFAGTRPEVVEHFASRRQTLQLAALFDSLKRSKSKARRADAVADMTDPVAFR